MKLYVFTSSSITNIWAGVGARLWAVPVPTGRQAQSIRTKAGRMHIGSCGVIYCSATQSLTTPFLVRSVPDQVRIVDDVWPEAWALPFGILPLGTPHRQLGKGKAMRTLQVAIDSGSSNISHVLPISAPTVFSPKDVPESDWGTLIDQLST